MSNLITIFEHRGFLKTIIETTIIFIFVAIFFYDAGINVNTSILKDIIAGSLISLLLSVAKFVYYSIFVLLAILLGEILAIEVDAKCNTGIFFKLLHNKVFIGLRALLLHSAIFSSCFIYILTALEVITLGKTTLVEILLSPSIFNEKDSFFVSSVYVHLCAVNFMVCATFKIYISSYVKDEKVCDKTKKNQDSIKKL